MEYILTLLVWIANAASPIGQCVLSLLIHIARNRNTRIAESTVRYQHRKVLFDFVRLAALEVDQHLDAGTAVQRLGAP